LRFKNHKTTILLPVNPTLSFETIKGHLLEALQITPSLELSGNQQIPVSPEDIVLGLPKDVNDLEAGWKNMNDTTEDMISEKRKGKSKKDDDNSMDTPLGRGLKDGSVLAFRFVDAEEKSTNKEDWDVVIATYPEDEMDAS
jgi:hypothetical protein